LSVAVIIPALNEAQAIGLVLDEIPRGEIAELIVVDNGSSDGTAEVARRHGATVVTEKNPGYGAACLRGIAALSGSTRIVVFLDADHSDYPEDLPELLEPIRRGSADFVVGSRVGEQAESGALQWNQRLGNALACTLIRWLYGTRYSDMGPFRAIRRESLARLGLTDTNFGWNAEMQVKAVICKLQIVEVPVRYRKRIGRSKISGTIRGTVLAGLKIIGTILKYYPHYRRGR
jgi:glycosyltransferase involved in cell wall biosynthesis